MHAYTDIDANNVPDPGSDPDGGPDLVFDFLLDLGQGPETYRPFAVTNLFYWNNLVHDMFYQYGLTEEAGNFQVNNYGRTTFVGGANDDVHAEAQDGSGTNNANFLTLADGTRPRMQMFRWNYPFANEVVVPSGGAAGTYVASGAAFGPSFTATGPKTGTVVLVDAGGALPNEGCGPLLNAGAIAGNIAMADPRHLSVRGEGAERAERWGNRGHHRQQRPRRPHHAGRRFRRGHHPVWHDQPRPRQSFQGQPAAGGDHPGCRRTGRSR